MFIEVEQETPDGLSKEVWRFYVNTDNKVKIILDRYYETERPSKRHKYRNNKSYSRLFSRESTMEVEEVLEPINNRFEILDL